MPYIRPEDQIGLEIIRCDNVERSDRNKSFLILRNVKEDGAVAINTDIRYPIINEIHQLPEELLRDFHTSTLSYISKCKIINAYGRKHGKKLCATHEEWSYWKGMGTMELLGNYPFQFSPSESNDINLMELL